MLARKLKVLIFNCRLKSAGRLEKRGGESEVIRAVTTIPKPGVASDEGEDEAWPTLRKHVLATDILHDDADG